MDMQDHTIVDDFYLLNDNDMKEICGGIDLSYSLLNSFTKIFDIFLEIGRSFGTSIRRMIKGNICPLE